MSDHVVSIKIYLAIFATLLVMTLLTVWVAYLDLGRFNAVVALSIAVFKATLVALYFMHLRYSSRLTWVMAASSVIWLVILLVFLMGDYLSRGWQFVPQAWT